MPASKTLMGRFCRPATMASRFFAVTAVSTPRSMSLAPSSTIARFVPSGTDQSSRSSPPCVVSPDTAALLTRTS